jgi:Ca-activated chloride channel family protein
VITGDRVLTGMIEKSDDAIEKYESAVAAGDAAFLAEQERPDVFTIRVGNIKPKQAAIVRLTYICPLDVSDNQIRVAFPTTVAPRYTTDSGMNPLDAAIDGDALNPPHVMSVPYGLTFTADVRLGRKVKSITSPTHAVQVAGDDREGYHVSLPGSVVMDREVVLSIELAKEVGPSVQFEVGKDNQSFLAVTFVPEFEALPEQPAASETIFVLDCSGSMPGESIAQATAALELCLPSLNVGDTFNICKFGSTFELTSPEPLIYSQATLERAIAWIATGNSFGGTELLQPLDAILRTRPMAGVVRSVILLTDGQVSNEPAILHLARQHRGRNRIFSFGIGPACSSFLVKGLARVTGGAAEFITAGESIHEKVLRTFARLASPLASDVQIDWDGAEAQTLAELPPAAGKRYLERRPIRPSQRARRKTMDSCTFCDPGNPPPGIFIGTSQWIRSHPPSPIGGNFPPTRTHGCPMALQIATRSFARFGRCCCCRRSSRPMKQSGSGRRRRRFDLLPAPPDARHWKFGQS